MKEIQEKEQGKKVWRKPAIKILNYKSTQGGDPFFTHEATSGIS
jgi:hypothetical protein